MRIVGGEPEVRVGSVETETPPILAATMIAKGGLSAGKESFKSIMQAKEKTFMDK